MIEEEGEKKAMIRCEECGGKVGCCSVKDIIKLLSLKEAENAGVDITLTIYSNDSPVMNL